ncbi:MAG: TRAP transporter large permease subunit [Roseomonas sp.]|nr:TRAP transporter large permease subunit [Roseomonas sp.]MCA3327336.1 TRAP transporter large permease subunit [Roseomonas sp.]MCA3330761.1 TRAP transporter large permease subunit [Roseomonas sp.]MCA3334250.1 TRAP transporter large permease subunit [Roseomonas sp.]MCA3354643.1 TRAP transporter large permease subunit [Roseomonas sp.]
MSDGMLGLTQLFLFLFFIMLGFPIAFTLMAMGLFFGYLGMQERIFDLLVQRTYAVMSNDVLISVPLFVLMGYIIERANILDRLFRSLQMASGNIPGSLAVATLATCALFATATGIVGAVVTLMGLLAFPAMLRAGYDVKLASGVVAAGGCLGILIPPSIMLILFGATAGVSVVQLYAAAFIPGVMLAGMYILYAMGIAIVKPEVAPRLPPEEVNIPFSQIAISLMTSFIPLAALIAMVLGAILMGLATPSEAAAMGSLGSIILAIAYRSFSFAKLKESVFLTARTSAMVCWLFVGSAIFSSVFGYLGGQDLVEQFFKSLPLNTFTFMILAQALIFILGWPLEWTEIIVIFVPIFLPLLDDFGVDPLFFGVMVALNLQTSFLSPPVAMAAFYLKGVAPKHVRLEDIFKGCMPFIYIVIMCMLAIYAFPGLVTWLPEQLYGSTPVSGTPIQLDAPPEGGFQEDEALKIAD